MAGTLTISTLSDGTNSTSSTNCIQGSAKAWVSFNGTGTVAIRGSYNVSSITDNGTGDYTVNFTNALANANYANTVSVAPEYGAALLIANIDAGTTGLTESAPTTTSFRFVVAQYTGTRTDSKYISVSVLS